jgi:hypothetical protein
LELFSAVFIAPSLDSPDHPLKAQRQRRCSVTPSTSVCRPIAATDGVADSVKDHRRSWTQHLNAARRLSEIIRRMHIGKVRENSLGDGIDNEPVPFGFCRFGLARTDLGTERCRQHLDQRVHRFVRRPKPLDLSDGGYGRV